MNNQQRHSHLALPIELAQAMYTMLSKLPFDQVANICIAFNQQGIAFTPSSESYTTASETQTSISESS